MDHENSSLEIRQRALPTNDNAVDLRKITIEYYRHFCSFQGFAPILFGYEQLGGKWSIRVKRGL